MENKFFTDLTIVTGTVDFLFCLADFRCWVAFYSYCVSEARYSRDVACG